TRYYPDQGWSRRGLRSAARRDKRIRRVTVDRPATDDHLQVFCSRSSKPSYGILARVGPKHLGRCDRGLPQGQGERGGHRGGLALAPARPAKAAEAIPTLRP